MRTLIVTALLALISTPAFADRVQDEATLRQLKTIEWNGYYRNRDAAGLEAFLADDFVHFGPDGSVEGKAEAVAFVRENDWLGASRDFRYRVISVSFASDTIANVYGEGSMTDPDCAEGQRAVYTSANLFRNEGGRWRPFFSHTSQSECRTAE